MEFITVITVSVIVALLNSAHVIIQWIANKSSTFMTSNCNVLENLINTFMHVANCEKVLDKPGEIFTGIAHSYADYFLYVGALAQGAAGRWIWSEHLFSNEPMAPTWYYWFYVTLGHLGSWMRLSPFASYNLSLILLVFLLCLVWYTLSKRLYPTNIFLRLTTWLFILTMTNFISFARPGLAKLSIFNIEVLGQFWFSPSPVFSRLGGVPYHAVQIMLFILLALLFSHLVAPKSTSLNTASSHGNMVAWFHLVKFYPVISLIIGHWKSIIDHWSLVIFGAFAFFAGSANPVQMLLFAASAGVTTLIASRRNFLPLGILLLSSGFGAWITNQEFARQTVFIAARAWELRQLITNSLPILLLSMGPALLFVPFGIRSVLNRNDPLRTLLLVWGLGSFVLFLSPIPRLLDLSPVRFLHPVPYAAALAILGAEGLFQLAHLLHQRLKKTFTINNIRAGLIALYLLLTIPAIAREFTDRITPAQNPQLLLDTIYNHVPAPITEALTWLRVTGLNPVSHQVVLVDPVIPIEVLIPVFTGKISFSGHPIHTLYPDVKEARRQEFFGGKMNSKDAAQFLKDHRIGFIITTPSRRLPVILQKVFNNATIVIYKATNE